MRSARRITGKIFAGLLCFGILFLASSVSLAAAENKAARVTATFPKNLSEDEIFSNGSFHVTLCFNDEMTINKKTKLSADIYIPSDALKKKGSALIIEPTLEVTSNAWHSISAKYNFRIKNNNGKIVVNTIAGDGSEKKASSSLATCKKSGKYYKLSIKKLPIKGSYTLWKDNGKGVEKKVTKETSQVNQVYFVRCNRKIKNKYFYFDNLKIAGQKTKTITYDKKDYGVVFGHDYNTDKDLKTKITKIQ